MASAVPRKIDRLSIDRNASASGPKTAADERPDQQPRADDRASSHQEQARVEEEPARAVQQEEPQMPPSVAPGAKVGPARAAVSAQPRRHLDDAKVREVRLHHHLARELHPRRAQVERKDAIATEGAHAAVKVTGAPAEEETRDEREHRVADVAMQRGHGP